MKHAHTLSITSTMCSVNTSLDVIDKPFRFAIAHISGFRFHRSRGLYCSGGGKRVHSTKMYFCVLRVGRLTRIQVEPYESEGQSYELCRSERNPADNKKTDSSSIAILQHRCSTCGLQQNSSGAKVGRQNSFIN